MILGVGIDGSIDCVARNTSMVSLILILAISWPLLNISINYDGHVTEDHLSFSASERNFTSFSLIAWSPKTPFAIRSSASSSTDSRGLRNSTLSISSSDNSSQSVNFETSFHWILLSLWLAPPPLSLEGQVFNASLSFLWSSLNVRTLSGSSYWFVWRGRKLRLWELKLWYRQKSHR